MKKALMLVGIIVLVVLVVFLAKRGSGPAPQNPSPMPPVAQTPSSEKPTETSPQIANPASVFCMDNGGYLASVIIEGREVSNCTLPNGTVCDEWKLFRGECVVEGVVNKATYTKDNVTVTAVFHIKAGTVILDAPSLNITAQELKVAEAASGAKYATPDEKITFWEHQGEATITQDDKETFMGMIVK
jgi:putative hemolysin/membrane-bound inhibitor of C-type lysozyme